MSKAWDVFFYYGDNSIEDENEIELEMGLIQPKRSLFYNRQEGAGVQEAENKPNSLSVAISLKYDIISWIAYRNTYISKDNPDRRILSSQDYVGFEQSGNELDVNILYINLATYKPESIAISGAS